MGLWTTLLLVFAAVWLSQIVGTYFQMRHYQRVLAGIKRTGDEGYVGVGNAKVRLGRGVILILVVGGDGLIKKALKMQGATVFARFRDAPELAGLRLEDLREEKESRIGKGVALAARRTAEQIERIQAEKEEAIAS